VRPPEGDLLRDARVLGRTLRPDLDLARRDVGHRAAAARRPKRRVPAAPWIGAALVVAALAVPGWALARPGAKPHAGPGAVAASTSGAPAVAGLSARIQPAVELDRARLAASVVRDGGGSQPGVAGPLPSTCSVDQLALEIAFESDQYELPQPIQVSEVLRNTSTRACTVPLDACHSSITVHAPSGALVYASGADPAWTCATSPANLQLAAGGSARLTFTWSPRPCLDVRSGCATGPGRYVVDATWAGFPVPIGALPRHLLVGGALQS
jgi:hypothetical protein